MGGKLVKVQGSQKINLIQYMGLGNRGCIGVDTEGLLLKTDFN
jgi:hypothetical protein